MVPDILLSLADAEAVAAADIAVPPRPLLLPKPALGLEVATRGTKRLVVVEGAFESSSSDS